MIKICLAGLAVLLGACVVVSGGHAWGALLFQLTGSVWLLYCFNKF